MAECQVLQSMQNNTCSLLLATRAKWTRTSVYVFTKFLYVNLFQILYIFTFRNQIKLINVIRPAPAQLTVMNY